MASPKIVPIESRKGYIQQWDFYYPSFMFAFPKFPFLFSPPRSLSLRPLSCFLYTPAATENDEMMETMKISKVLAMNGIASRREAEKLVQNGKVMVNNKPVTNVATRIFPFGAKIKVNGKDCKPLHARDWKPDLFVHYKMPRILVSHKPDDTKRPILFPVLEQMLGSHPAASHLVSVGRLDFLSEGILLITNDGSLARHLELPSSNFKRKYEMNIHGHITDSKLRAVRHGVKIEGILYAGIDITILKSTGTAHLVCVEILEGKNRELRNIFAHFNWRVSKLKRIQYGPYRLNTIPKGGLLEVPLKGSLVHWYEARRKKLVEYELLNTGKEFDKLVYNTPGLMGMAGEEELFGPREWISFSPKLWVDRPPLADNDLKIQKFCMSVQDGSEKFSVVRTWNDFTTLNSMLQQEFPNYPLPKAPVASLFQRLNWFAQEDTAEQYKNVEIFLTSLLRHPIFSQSPSFRRFFTPKIAQIFRIPPIPEELRFTEHILSLAIVPMFNDLQIIFQCMSAVSHYLDRNISAESKGKLIETMKDELITKQESLEKVRANLKQVDSRMLDLRRPFTAFYSHLLCATKECVTYMNDILCCDDCSLLEGYRISEDADNELSPTQARETLQEIYLHEIQLLESKLVELRKTLKYISDSALESTTAKAKRELLLEYRMLAFSVDGLLDLPLEWAENKLDNWTQELTKIKAFIGNAILQLDEADSSHLVNGNPLLKVSKSITECENELERLILVPEEALQQTENGKFFFNSLDSLLRVVSKIKSTPITSQTLTNEQLDAFHTRANALQNQIVDILATSKSKYGDPRRAFGGDYVKERQIQQANQQNIALQEQLFTL